jgi:hypothetical protein
MNDSKKKSTSSSSSSTTAKPKQRDYYENDIELDEEDDNDDDDLIDDDEEEESSDVDFMLNDDTNNLLNNNNNNSLNVNSQRTHDTDEEFKYEVLTPDKIVQHMIECIKEVNQVVEVLVIQKRNIFLDFILLILLATSHNNSHFITPF